MSSGFPKKEERKQCWEARDVYWKCLDDNAGDREKCVEPRKPYVAACSNTWVKYFDRRYDYLKYREKMEKGYEPIETKK